MSNKHNTHISNVLVIGSGGAGLRAAIEAKSKGVDTKSISDQIDKVKEDIDDITGSIKRDL